VALALTANVECAQCGAVYDGWWIEAAADTVQDLEEAPVQEQTCPCGHVQEEQWPGWTFRTEAG
jgi:hypothetical protein